MVLSLHCLVDDHNLGYQLLSVTFPPLLQLKLYVLMTCNNSIKLESSYSLIVLSLVPFNHINNKAGHTNLQENFFSNFISEFLTEI